MRMQEGDCKVIVDGREYDGNNDDQVSQKDRPPNVLKQIDSNAPILSFYLGIVDNLSE